MGKMAGRRLAENGASARTFLGIGKPVSSFYENSSSLMTRRPVAVSNCDIGSVSSLLAHLLSALYQRHIAVPCSVKSNDNVHITAD